MARLGTSSSCVRLMVRYRAFPPPSPQLLLLLLPHAQVALGAGTYASRMWFFEGNNNALLEHDCMIGRRVLFVNGREIYNETIFPDRSFEITFKIGAHVGSVSVVNVHKELAIYYTLKWKGKEVTSTIFDTSSASASKSLDGTLDVAVTTAVNRGDVTMYKIVCKDKSTGTSVSTVERRFSEFVELYQKIWSSYAGSHLQSNIPKPPDRKWKMFTNHRSASFVETRRVGLHGFLTKLLQMPRIAQNVYLLKFIEVPMGKKGQVPMFVGVGPPGEAVATAESASAATMDDATASAMEEGSTKTAVALDGEETGGEKNDEYDI